jgi:hypothetical protein
MADDACSRLGGNFSRFVGRSVIDDDDFGRSQIGRGKHFGHIGNRLADGSFLIERGNDNRDHFCLATQISDWPKNPRVRGSTIRETGRIYLSKIRIWALTASASSDRCFANRFTHQATPSIGLKYLSSIISTGALAHA